MSDKDIKNWDERLKRHVDKKWDNYIRRRIHLDTARLSESWPITGEFVYVEEVSSDSARASVCIDRNTNPALDLVKGTIIKTVFESLYVTHVAQTGEWLDLIIGINFEYYKPGIIGNIGDEAQPVLNLTHLNPNTSVAAAANICNSALIKADVQNTGISWIDFGIAAVQNSCIPLDPGEWIRVSIPNTDQINANFEVGSETVYICYEV